MRWNPQSLVIVTLNVTSIINSPILTIMGLSSIRNMLEAKYSHKIKNVKELLFGN